MIPIPENIREVLFRFNWDKVLVDVRRTVSIAPRGKQWVGALWGVVVERTDSSLGRVLCSVSEASLIIINHREVYTAMVAVGNQQGLLGLGVAEAATAQDAVAKAHMDSYSNLQFVPLYRGHTIFHRIDHDFHRMKVRVQQD